MRTWLKKIRINAHLSQHNVADRAGISQQFYCFIEAGVRGKKIPVKTAKAIAAVLGFDWSRFYDEESESA